MMAWTNVMPRSWPPASVVCAAFCYCCIRLDLALTFSKVCWFWNGSEGYSRSSAIKKMARFNRPHLSVSRLSSDHVSLTPLPCHTALSHCSTGYTAHCEQLCMTVIGSSIEISAFLSILSICLSFTLSLQAQNLPCQQILPTLDFFYLPDCLHDNGTGPDLSRSF